MEVVGADWIARSHGSTPFVRAQNEYGLLRRGIEADGLTAVQHAGLGLLAFYALASGLLNCEYRRGESASAHSRVRAWGLIVGATSAARLAGNLATAQWRP